MVMSLRWYRLFRFMVATKDESASQMLIGDPVKPKTQWSHL